MTRKTTYARKPHRVQPDNHVYLPHSSWTRVERKTVDEAIAPDDFWARLGL